MSNLIFDGIGYVSNRGFSKYWGVSKCPLNTWRVQINDASRDNITLQFDFSPTEQLAAKVAACLKKYHPTHLPSLVNLKIGDDLYRVTSTPGSIIRLPKSLNDHTFVDVDFDGIVDMNSVNTIFDEKESEIAPANEVITSIYNWILEDKIDKKTAALISSMMDVIAK